MYMLNYTHFDDAQTILDLTHSELLGMIDNCSIKNCVPSLDASYYIPNSEINRILKQKAKKSR